MKKLILLLAAMPAFTFAQEKYIIQGKIGNLNPPAVAHLSYATNGILRADSSSFTNGAFRFSGEADVVTQARLVVQYQRNVMGETAIVYLVNGTTTINTADSLKHATVTGNKTNEEAFEYAKKRGDETDFIVSHPDSYVSLQLIKNMGGAYPDYNSQQPRFDQLSAAIRNSKTGVQYQAFLNTLKQVAVGAMAPDFTQSDTSGNPVTLSSFRGKYVLIDFWASWCHPCRNENPNVVKAYNTYKNKNFTVLSVSLDGPAAKAAWLKAVRHDGLTWTNVSDPEKAGWDNEASKLYGITAIPQNALVDPDGKIIARNIFGEALNNKLKEVL